MSVAHSTVLSKFKNFKISAFFFKKFIFILKILYFHYQTQYKFSVLKKNIGILFFHCELASDMPSQPTPVSPDTHLKSLNPGV